MKTEVHNLVWGADAANTKLDGVPVGSAYAAGLVTLSMPVNLRSVALQAVSGDVSIVNSTYDVTGATATLLAKWTLANGDKEAIDGADLAGQKLYVYAASGTTLQLRYIVFGDL